DARASQNERRKTYLHRSHYALPKHHARAEWWRTGAKWRCLFLFHRNTLASLDRAYGTRDHFWRTRKDPVNQLLDLFATHECGFKMLLFGVGKKFGISHHGFEGLAKYSHALRRGAGGRDDRVGHVLPGEDQIEHPTIGIVLGEVRDQGCRIHPRMFLQAE